MQKKIIKLNKQMVIAADTAVSAKKISELTKDITEFLDENLKLDF